MLVGHVDGRGYPGANYREVLYFVNVDKVAHSLNLSSEAGKRYELHPVQAARGAADKRVRDAQATECTRSGNFTIPPRSTVVCVVD